MNKLFASLFFVLLSLYALSQNVTINGTANGQANKLIRVIVYSDQFTKLEQTITQTRTSNSGEFFLEFEVDQVKFAYMALGIDKGEFYLTPGANYNFNILVDTISKKGSIFDKLPLNFTIDADDENVQKAVGDFNIAYNEFIYNNINKIYKSRDKSVVMQFVKEMQEKYTDNPISNQDKYVSNYVTYSLAQLLWLSKKENNNQILINYFVNKPVLYNNIQYTDFFREFFKSYFTTEKVFSYEELILAINNKSTLVIDTLLANDEQLALDDRIREIVEMQLLARNYYNRDVNKKRVISKFNNIAVSSEFIENRLIAKNYIIKLQELQNGSKAPDFTLTSYSDSSISLNDFTGKFVLLNFVREDCKICDFQMQLIYDIRQQNNNEFEIITIFAGNRFERLINFAKERGWDWTILNLEKNILLLEDYNIKAYPSYIFINPDGTIAYAHLPMPDENMELYLIRFMESYNEKNN